jgi:hypothetical protein
MNAAKIHLSVKELQLAGNAEWILTKNQIMEKTKILLGALQQRQQTFSANLLPAELVHSSPKISRGENYKGLPYLVLDYPRYFKKEDIFVIRCMFLWGNFFSITLQTGGKYSKPWRQKLMAHYSGFARNCFYICVNEDPWQHDFDKSNYAELKQMPKKDFENLILNKPFIKLAKKIPLQQWEEAGKKLLKGYKEILTAISR